MGRSRRPDNGQRIVDEIGAPVYDPFSADGANFNLLVRHEPSDPVSASVPHRAYVCEITRASEGADGSRQS